jgi:hypothetical protein
MSDQAQADAWGAQGYITVVVTQLEDANGNPIYVTILRKPPADAPTSMTLLDPKLEEFLKYIKQRSEYRKQVGIFSTEVQFLTATWENERKGLIQEKIQEYKTLQVEIDGYNQEIAAAKQQLSQIAGITYTSMMQAQMLREKIAKFEALKTTPLMRQSALKAQIRFLQHGDKNKVMQYYASGGDGLMQSGLEKNFRATSAHLSFAKNQLTYFKGALASLPRVTLP